MSGSEAILEDEKNYDGPLLPLSSRVALALLRIAESTPVVGLIIAASYLIARRRHEAERVLVWSLLGLIPFLNIWRYGVIIYSASQARTTRLRGQEKSPRWMEERFEALRSKKLQQMVIPGSHDSATSEFAFSKGLLKAWSQCQDIPVRNQLDLGIRFLDFRLTDTSSKSSIRSKKVGCRGACFPDRRFWRLEDRDDIWIAHTYLCQPLRAAIEDIVSFLLANEREVVIVALKGDWPEKLTPQAWGRVREKFEKAIATATAEGSAKQLVLACDTDLQRTYGDLVRENKRLVVLGQDCSALPCIDSHIVGSWSQTRSVTPAELRKKLRAWLKAHQRDMSTQSPHESFHLLQGEITPDTPMILHSLLTVRCIPHLYLDTHSAALAANRVILNGLAKDWNGLHCNVITHDFVDSHIIKRIIDRNSATA